MYKIIKIEHLTKVGVEQTTAMLEALGEAGIPDLASDEVRIFITGRVHPKSTINFYKLVDFKDGDITILFIKTLLDKNVPTGWTTCFYYHRLNSLVCLSTANTAERLRLSKKDAANPDFMRKIGNTANQFNIALQTIWYTIDKMWYQMNNGDTDMSINLVDFLLINKEIDAICYALAQIPDVQNSPLFIDSVIYDCNHLTPMVE